MVTGLAVNRTITESRQELFMNKLCAIFVLSLMGTVSAHADLARENNSHQALTQKEARKLMYQIGKPHFVSPSEDFLLPFGWEITPWEMRGKNSEGRCFALVRNETVPILEVSNEDEYGQNDNSLDPKHSDTAIEWHHIEDWKITTDYDPSTKIHTVHASERTAPRPLKECLSPKEIARDNGGMKDCQHFSELTLKYEERVVGSKKDLRLKSIELRARQDYDNPIYYGFTSRNICNF
jgi:hypothetical protein